MLATTEQKFEKFEGWMEETDLRLQGVERLQSQLLKEAECSRKVNTTDALAVSQKRDIN